MAQLQVLNTKKEFLSFQNLRCNYILCCKTKHSVKGLGHGLCFHPSSSKFWGQMHDAKEKDHTNLRFWDPQMKMKIVQYAIIFPSVSAPRFRLSAPCTGSEGDGINLTAQILLGYFHVLLTE